MTFTEFVSHWTTITIGATVILSGVGTGVWWMVRKVLAIYNKAVMIHDQMVPNGGGSLRDAIDKLTSALRMSEQRHRSMLSLVDTAIFESSPHGGCLWVNRAYLRMADRSLEEVLGNGWLNIIHPGDQDRVWRAWKSCIEQEREFSMEYRIVCSEGLITRVVCQTTIMRGDKREVLGYYGALWAIADKKRAA